MADRIYLPRATDSTGDPVASATAYFYEDGTSTPLTVYESEALSTPRGTSVAADAEGVFPACWVASGTGVKVDIQDSGGTSLPGYPNDDNGRFAVGGSQASSVTMTPHTGNTATTVQGAIENNTSALNVLEELSNPQIATGSGGAYAITANTTISAYETGQLFAVIMNHSNVGGGSDTLNVDAQGAVVIKRRTNTTSKADLIAGNLSAGDTVVLIYDGTNFVIMAHFSGQVFRLLDEDNFASNSAIYPPSQQSAKVYVDGQDIGVGQSWQAPTRAMATNYQNTTGKPIHVIIQGENIEIQVSNDGFSSNIVTLIGSGAAGSGFDRPASFIVPNNHYYRAANSGGGAITYWRELR